MNAEKSDRSLYLIATSPLLLWFIGSSFFRVDTQLLKFNFTPAAPTSLQDGTVTIQPSQVRFLSGAMVVTGSLANKSDRYLVAANATLQTPNRLLLEIDGRQILMGPRADEPIRQLSIDEFHWIDPGSTSTFVIRIPVEMVDGKLVIETPDGDLTIKPEQSFRIALRCPATTVEQLTPESAQRLGLEDDQSVTLFQGVEQTNWLQVKGLTTEAIK